MVGCMGFKKRIINKTSLAGKNIHIPKSAQQALLWGEIQDPTTFPALPF